MGIPSGTNWFVLNLAESLPNYVMYLSKLLLNWVGHEYTCTPISCNHFHYVDCSLRYFLPEIRIDFLHMTRNGKISIQLKTGWSITSYDKSPQTSQVNYVELNQVYWAIKSHYTLHLILTTMQKNNLPNFFYISFSFITHQFLKTFLSAFSGLITRLSVIAKRAPKYLS